MRSEASALLVAFVAVLSLSGCTEESSGGDYTLGRTGDQSAGHDGAASDGRSSDGGQADGSVPDGAPPADGNSSHDGGRSDGAPWGDVSLPGDGLCPPCAPPPSPDCVGSGPCGCGPYECPGDGDAICGTNSIGWCPSGSSCECCPGGGPTQNCLCTSTCTIDDDCRDPSMPMCNSVAPGTSPGICTSTTFFCCWLCV